MNSEKLANHRRAIRVKKGSVQETSLNHCVNKIESFATPTTTAPPMFKVLDSERWYVGNLYLDFI